MCMYECLFASFFASVCAQSASVCISVCEYVCVWGYNMVQLLEKFASHQCGHGFSPTAWNLGHILFSILRK